MQKGSEKDIAKRNNVSPNHVNRILDKIFKDKLVKNYDFLPKQMNLMQLKILNLKWHLLLLITIIETSLTPTTADYL